MAKGSRPEDDTPPRRAKRRRRPPVLDLKAREVTGESSSARDDQPKESPKQERAAGSAGAAQAPAWEKLWTQAKAGDWRALAPTPVLTGALGAIVGALIVFLLMPRGEPADPRVGQLTEEVATLSARIESLAARPPPPAPDQSGLGERIDRLTAAIGEAEQRLAAVEQRPAPPAPDLSSVNQRAAAIEGTLKELRASLFDLKRLAEQTPEAASPKSIDELSGRIGGLEERIAALAAVRAAPPPPPPAPPASSALAAEIVALNALGSALRSGKPFATELETAQARLGERAEKLAPLRPHAASGLPTVKQLEAQFAELAPRLLRGPEANGNFFERLMTNASRLVEVRPVGEPTGMSAGAIVARAETKLARGDLGGAIAEVESLPEPAKAAAAKWLAAAVQRRDGEALVQSLAEASLAGAREAAKP